MGIHLLSALGSVRLPRSFTTIYIASAFDGLSATRRPRQ